MTDRIRHVTVTLDRDYRDDDVEVILSAIKMIKGVSSVTTKVVEAGDYLARESVRADLELKMHEAVQSVFQQERVRRKVNDR
jgi:hypothetical protein